MLARLRTIVVLLAAAALLAPAAAEAKPWPRCVAEAQGPYTEDDPAVDYFVDTFGGSRKRAKRWLDVQAFSETLFTTFREVAHREALGMAFGNRHLHVQVFVRPDRRQDAAIRHCARQLGINKYLRLIVHHWSNGELLRAGSAVTDALPDLYEADLFETSYGASDWFDIDVYAPATDDQVGRIRKAARATHVGFRIHRHQGTRPDAVLD